MGRLKQRQRTTETQRESTIRRTILAYEKEQYSSIRKTADAFGVGYTTLHQRLNGGQSRSKANISWQLCTLAEKKAIVRRIVKLEEWGFPPRIVHVKEAVVLLKGKEWDEKATVGRNWITRFLNRHPELVSKLSSQFDKKRINASDPNFIRSHFLPMLVAAQGYLYTKKYP